MQKIAKNALIVFIKNPEKGKVKTRLAQSVGDDMALAIYKALLKHTRKVAEVLTVERHLFYHQNINEKDDWQPSKFHKNLQIEGDLGHKMAAAFQKIFRKNDKVVIIGSDCPTLTPEIVQEAFDKLEEFPFVIGPAMDGGYYLLGMSQFLPTVFGNIEWSTSTVFSTTIQRIETMNKSYYLLPKISDVDYAEDWEKYGWEIRDYPKKPITKYKTAVITPQTKA